MSILEKELALLVSEKKKLITKISQLREQIKTDNGLKILFKILEIAKLYPTKKIIFPALRYGIPNYILSDIFEMKEFDEKHFTKFTEKNIIFKFIIFNFKIKCDSISYLGIWPYDSRPHSDDYDDRAEIIEIYNKNKKYDLTFYQPFKKGELIDSNDIQTLDGNDAHSKDIECEEQIKVIIPDYVLVLQLK